MHWLQQNLALLCGLHYKSFTIVICNRNDMAGTIKLNYNHNVLAGVVNYNRKRDTTNWSIDHWGLYYKTIYGRSFRIFVIS